MKFMIGRRCAGSTWGKVARTAAVGLGLAVVVSASTAWSQAKQPPSCAAISFRAIPAGFNDGEQNAGLYRSRFGLLEVMGTVKGGQVEKYYVTVNNKPTAPADNLPASVASCASAKHLPAPGKPAADACVGDRLSVLVDHTGDKRYVLLYARQSGAWKLCSAGVA